MGEKSLCVIDYARASLVKPISGVKPGGVVPRGTCSFFRTRGPTVETVGYSVSSLNGTETKS